MYDSSLVAASLENVVVELRLGTSTPEHIIPKSDTSVLYTSAAICRFKQALLEKNSAERSSVTQWCFRARRLDTLRQGLLSEWNSAFRQFGIVAPPEGLPEITHGVAATLAPLCKQYGRRLGIKLRSSDLELRDAAEGISCEVIADSEPEGYYRHVYGHARLSGRNANLAIWESEKKTWRDFGNVIVIERDGAPFAIEIAIGVETLTGYLHGAKTSIYAASICTADVLNAALGCPALVDLLAISLHLFHAGVRPFSSNRGRIFRKALDAFVTLSGTRGAEIDKLISLAAPIVANHYEGYFAPVDPRILVEYLEERAQLSKSMKSEEVNAFMARRWPVHWNSAYDPDGTPDRH